MPVSVSVMCWSQRPSSWARTNGGISRSTARVAASTHSAVTPPCAPWQSESCTPSGSRPTHISAPAESSCTRRRFGQRSTSFNASVVARKPGISTAARSAASGRDVGLLVVADELEAVDVGERGLALVVGHQHGHGFGAHGAGG